MTRIGGRLSHRLCNLPETKNRVNSAFQQYPTVSESLVTEIPDSLSFAQAAVLPLAIATACSGLYHPEYLNLPLSSATDAKSRERWILIWGGASSVGATAIQLAAASGYYDCFSCQSWHCEVAQRLYNI